VTACGEKKDTGERSPVRVDTLSSLLNEIAKDSSKPDGWEKLYRLYLDMGDTAKALDALGRYTYLDPENGNAWVELAWLLSDTRDPRAVVITDSLKKVADPEISSRAAYIGGIYHSNINNDDRALVIFDSLIKTNYTFLDAYIEKGIIQHDRKQYAEALKTFRQALSISSSTAELYYWISRCYEGLGNTAEAEDWRKKYEALR
jgi:tetratricopeptide (TPR) repeat protein